MRLAWAAAVVAVAGGVVVTTASVTSCGSSCTGASCNGVTVDTFVHFTFIAVEYPGFNETAGGVGAKSVKLDFTGPTNFSNTTDAQFGQVKLSDLAQGHYAVTGTLLDVNGMAITKGMAHVEFDTTGANQDVYIDFPYEDFIQSYTGTYYFSVTWNGGATCAAAVPMVAHERFLLSRGGVALTGTTINGDALDGSTDLACYMGTSDQAAPGLPWGPAMMTITGEDAAGDPLWQETFPTFVGADLSNPSFVFDVKSSDAGP